MGKSTPKWRFDLPPLPKPEYHALRKMCHLLEATQLEVVCVGLRLACARARGDDLPNPLADGVAQLRIVLADFRASAPSDTAPLL